MSIKNNHIYHIATFYVTSSIILFFLGWLKPIVGIALSLILIVAEISFYKRINTIQKFDLKLDYKLFLSIICIFIFVLISGNTGFIGTWGVDIPVRDAIYQDLIKYDWPVIYDYSQSALVYYITFWLVPAFISRVLSLGLLASNIVLYLWISFGVVILFLCICEYLKIENNYLFIVLTIFLLWSGINIIGMIGKSIFAQEPFVFEDTPGSKSWLFTGIKIHGYIPCYMIRTVFDSIANAYNQFIILGILCIIFLKFKSEIKYYALFGLLALPYSPLGFIGFFYVLLGVLVVSCFKRYKNKHFKSFIKEVFSTSNLFAIISIIPVFFCYFSINVSINTSKTMSSFWNEILNAGNSSVHPFFAAPLNAYGPLLLITLFTYYILYFGFYLYCIFNDYKKEELFWISLSLLLLIPFFKIGTGVDLVYNGSMIPFIIIMVMVIHHVIIIIKTKTIIRRDIFLFIILILAFLTPIIQIATSFRGACLNKSIAYHFDDFVNGTLGDKDPEVAYNFIKKGYEKTLFYKFLVKKSEGDNWGRKVFGDEILKNGVFISLEKQGDYIPEKYLNYLTVSIDGKVIDKMCISILSDDYYYIDKVFLRQCGISNGLVNFQIIPNKYIKDKIKIKNIGGLNIPEKINSKTNINNISSGFNHGGYNKQISILKKGSILIDKNLIKSGINISFRVPNKECSSYYDQQEVAVFLNDELIKSQRIEYDKPNYIFITPEAITEVLDRFVAKSNIFKITLVSPITFVDSAFINNKLMKEETGLLIDYIGPPKSYYSLKKFFLKNELECFYNTKKIKEKGLQFIFVVPEKENDLESPFIIELYMDEEKIFEKKITREETPICYSYAFSAGLFQNIKSIGLLKLKLKDNNEKIDDEVISKKIFVKYLGD